MGKFFIFTDMKRTPLLFSVTVLFFFALMLLTSPAYAVTNVTGGDTTMAANNLDGYNIQDNSNLKIIVPGSFDIYTNNLGGNYALSAISTENNGDGILEFQAVNFDGHTSNIYGTIGATNDLNRIDVDGAGTVNFLGSVTTDNGIIDSAAATLNFADGVDVSGTTVAIDDDTGVNDTVTFQGNSTVSGTVGATNAINTINAGAAGKGVTFNNAVTATTMNLTGAAGEIILNGGFTGTLDFDNGATGTVKVADNQTLTGAVTATTPGQGILTYAGSSTIRGLIGVVGGNELAAVNFNAAGGTTETMNVGYDIAATLISIADKVTCNLTASKTFEGAVSLAAGDDTDDAGIDLNGNTLTVTGNLTMGANTDMALDINGTSSYGHVDVSGTPTIPASVDLAVNVNSYIPNGSTFTVVDGNAGALVAGGNTVTSNLSTVNFTAQESGNQDLILTATKTYNSLATSGNNTKAVATALATAGSTNATGDMQTALWNIDSLSSGSSVDSAMKQLYPCANAGAIDTSTSALNQGVQTIISRVNEIRNSFSGVSTGDNPDDMAIWAKGFGTYTKQDKRKGIEGYDASVLGTALGFEMKADENSIFGVSVGYSYGVINSDRTGINNTDINNLLTSLYYGYRVNSAFIQNDMPYLNLVGSFGWNWYDGSRHISFGSINRTADYDTNGQQYSAYGELGYMFPYKGLQITPLASLHYIRLNIDGYTETGANALDLKVDDQSYDVLEQGIGLKLAYPVKEKGYDIIPEIRGKWLYDYVGDKQETTSRFTGGGPSFSTNGSDPAQNMFVAGGSLTFVFKDNIDLTLGYDLALKEDYYSHNGTATLKYRF